MAREGQLPSAGGWGGALGRPNLCGVRDVCVRQDLEHVRSHQAHAVVVYLDGLGGVAEAKQIGDNALDRVGEERGDGGAPTVGEVTVTVQEEGYVFGLAVGRLEVVIAV